MITLHNLFRNPTAGEGPEGVIASAEQKKVTSVGYEGIMCYTRESSISKREQLQSTSFNIPLSLFPIMIFSASMSMSMSMSMCKRTMSVLDMPSGVIESNFYRPRLEREKVVILLGATGTGKSRLSIDLATRFPAEIINSDKIQVHAGLDIATNKIPEEERCGIPHHLLGVIHPNADFTATNFVNMASDAMASILSRSQVPIIAGGSNSYIEALNEDFLFRSKYECCFLCVDVAMPVLDRYVSDRVDKMVEMGMVDEVRNFFDANANYTVGIRKAIGVPEFDRYFRAESYLNKRERDQLLQQAVQEIKRNTCKLARRQLEKIHRLRNKKNWKIHRVDATEVFLQRGKKADEAWEKLVAGPSTEIVTEFLYNFSSETLSTIPPLECHHRGTELGLTIGRDKSLLSL
ncbi:hypothetical protein V6N12_058980 [Hibiscus sabdariffa]|uniref:Adenylate isopentenyltransferase 3, chloroplastic n=1 Tax=Hibiscus sabdariffa TaxID=183260 RepID=A0ABR2ETQ5_9ROSI